DTELREAVYVAGTGSDTLTFHYPVQAGDYASGGITIGPAVVVSGGAVITDRFGNEAQGSFMPVSVEGVSIDGVTARVVRVLGPQGGFRYYRRGAELRFRVEFDLPVVAEQPQGLALPLRIGPMWRPARYVSGLGSRVLVFAYRVSAADEAVERLRLGREIGGELRSVYGGEVLGQLPMTMWTNLKLDGRAPRVRMVVVPHGGHRVGDWLEFRITWDEAVVVRPGQGRPVVRFTLGGRQRTAVYFAGSGTLSLWFRYRLTKEDSQGLGKLVYGRVSGLLRGRMEDLAGNHADREIASARFVVWIV
ncbi:MAG: hypothetical protein RMI91_15110, partial [Gemmatales bacterium]|nr:hypothetical protein [Gemmatales bacterium]